MLLLVTKLKLDILTLTHALAVAACLIELMNGYVSRLAHLRRIMHIIQRYASILGRCIDAVGSFANQLMYRSTSMDRYTPKTSMLRQLGFSVSPLTVHPVSGAVERLRDVEML